MPDPSIVWAAALLGITGTICAAALRAWRGWLELKRLELASRREASEVPELAPAVRIEMANLKERLRKLEAIAKGVDP